MIDRYKKESPCCHGLSCFEDLFSVWNLQFDVGVDISVGPGLDDLSEWEVAVA